MTSSRFALAVHVLAALALRDGEAVPSEMLARSVNTNAAFLRQVMGRLRRVGLVATRLGAGGGAMLGKPATKIHLDEIYRATEDTPLICTHHSAPSPKCLVGRHILPVLEDVIRRVESSVGAELHKTTVADIARRISRRA